ncbi:MAG: TIGR02646 family protein [Magnetococcales bacterium]|nr:TIGR02646 family protein [Magnetococcales bacterium]
MHSSIKKPLKKSLMEEQGYICCYCERRISEDDSHIDHLRPQEEFGWSALDYGNMLCSCQLELARNEPRHCGNSKGSWFNSELLISPLDPSCENRFFYSLDGSICPADEKDMAATMTIEKLNLDGEKLNRLRKAAIEAFIMDPMETILAELHREGMKEFYEFHTAIRIYYASV